MCAAWLGIDLCSWNSDKSGLWSVIKLKCQPIKYTPNTHDSPSFSICHTTVLQEIKYTKWTQLTFLYHLASCKPILPQFHNLRHHKLGEQVTWNRNEQALSKITAYLLTSKMAFVPWNPIAILHFDRGVHKVVPRLMVGVAKICHNIMLTGLSMISVLWHWLALVLLAPLIPFHLLDEDLHCQYNNPDTSPQELKIDTFLSPAFSNLVSTSFKDSKCLLLERPTTKISSKYSTTTGMPCNKLSTTLWKFLVQRLYQMGRINPLVY